MLLGIYKNGGKNKKEEKQAKVIGKKEREIEAFKEAV